MKMTACQFRDVITDLCQRYHIPDDVDYLIACYWPAFSRLDEVGQQAFLAVVGYTSPTSRSRSSTCSMGKPHVGT